MTAGNGDALEERRLTIDGEAAMLAFAEKAGASTLKSGALVVHLEGELGAGKTTLARGWLAGMGYTGRVKSPTYTLLEPYDIGSLSVAHLDLYRLADPEELEFLGLRELSDGSTTLLVEWPEKGREHLPPADVDIHSRYAGDGRMLRIRALTTRGAQWLALLEADTALQ